MDNFIKLKGQEVVSDRPFTHPERGVEDLAVMRHIVHSLRLLLSQAQERPDHSHSFILGRQEADGRDARIVICNRERLLSEEELFLVGFFGHRRPGVEWSVVDALDEDLIREFPAHPGILSYNSYELPDGNYANLVLLSPPETAEHWRVSAKHAYAAHDLSPDLYTSVRLHNGVLPGGLMEGGDPVLIRTKYYDYSGTKIWQAVREIAHHSEGQAHEHRESPTVA